MNRHVKHLAKSHKIAAADLAAVIDLPTLAAACAAIRKRTGKSAADARKRYDAAIDAAAEYRKQARVGNIRRGKSAMPPALDLLARKIRQIDRIMPYKPGEYYSGKTSWTCVPIARGVTAPYAATATEKGGQYYGRYHHRKTNAKHTYGVSLSDLVAARAAGIPARIDGWQVVRAKQVRADIFLVDLLGSTRNQATAKQCYAARQTNHQWYLCATERGAVVALNRDIRADEASRENRINAIICRAWGWCAEGMRQWCAKNGITRNLAARLRSGASSAALARLIRKHGGPSNGYEKRLVLAAGLAA